MPESVTSLGDGCFVMCESLILATVLPAIPPSIGMNVFSGVPTSFNIKVPDESVDAYKTASGWSEFSDNIKPISTKP